MDIKTLASLFYRVTKAWDMPVDSNNKPLPCKRINTFAVIHSEAQINTENLEKIARYKNRDLFYSRSWEASGYNNNSIKVEYPAFYIWQENTQINDPLGFQDLVRTDYVFLVLDKMPIGETKCKDCTYCDLRVFEDIASDVRYLGLKMLKTLGSFNYYQLIKLGVVIGEGWYTQSEIDYMIANTTIDSANNIHSAQSLINTSVTAETVPHVFADDLMGFFVRVSLTDNQCVEAVEINTDRVNSEYNFKQGCC